ncbi:hypothetical protein LINPERPRIM_LOCUS20731 [Linum perenne]
MVKLVFRFIHNQDSFWVRVL